MFTNYFVLACICMPWLTFIFYNQFHDFLVTWVPNADYYILKLGWNNMKLYKYWERQNGIFIEYLRNVLPKTKDTKVMLISKDGEVHSTRIERFNDQDNIDFDYEMVLVQFEVKDYALNKYKYEVVRTSSIDTITDSFELSNTRFLGIQLNIKEGNRIFKSVEVYFNSHNFYVVRNILFDRLFVNYWLKQNHNFTMSEEQCYEIVFFDQNIQQHTVSEPDHIKLKKEGFEIVKPSIAS